MDLKTVYEPDSSESYGDRIRFEGGQSQVIAKIDAILEIRKQENNGVQTVEEPMIKNDATLSRIQQNYTIDTSSIGITGQAQDTTRFDTNYKRVYSVLRYNNDLEQIASTRTKL